MIDERTVILVGVIFDTVIANTLAKQQISSYTGHGYYD